MGLMKKLTSAVVASSLVLGIVGTAVAAPSTEQQNDAFARLNALKVVEGRLQADGTIDAALGENLTRAELVTILARAFGQEQTAQLLKGAASFPDVAASEWYSGYVALIKNIAGQKNISVGYEDGTFRPANNVTSIEALAFIMKLLGVQAGTGENWVADTVAAAVTAGVITEADAALYLDAPNAAATRGLAFSLSDAIFRSFQVAPGKTVYTTYVDAVAPALTINKPAEPTTVNATYSVTGKAEVGAAVFFGSEQIATNADGSFTVEVNLAVGANTVAFSAVDVAGNVTTESFTLTRNAGAADKVTASLSAESVKAGATAELTYSIVDANGVALQVNAEDVNVVVGGEIGSFDKATGTFTASTKAGAGTITVSYGTLTAATVNVKVVAGDLAKVEAETASVAPGTAVKLVAKDAYGNAVEGATFAKESADAFLEGNSFVATKAGQYTVTATKDGVTVSGVVGVFGAVAKTVIEAPAVIVANDETEYTFTVKAVDAEGNLVTTAANAIELNVPAGFAPVSSKSTKNGVATFTYTVAADLADADLTLTANYDGNGDNLFTDTANNKKGSVVVTPVAQVATKISLTPASEYLATDLVSNTNTISVSVVDQVGVDMATGTWEMDITVTGPALLENGKKTDSISVGNDSSFVISPEDAGAAGNITISAAFSGLTSGTASVKAAMPGIASALKLTASKNSIKADDDATAASNKNVVTYTLVAVDRNGVPTVTDAPVAVTLTLDSDLDNEYSFFAAGADDLGAIGGLGGAGLTHTFDLSAGAVTFKVAASKVGSYDLSAAATNYTKVSHAFSVTPAAPAVAALTKGDVDVLRVTDTTAVATAQLYDKYGNATAVGGVTLSFSAGSYDGVKVNGKEEAVKVTTDENGKASVTVSLASYKDNASIEVTDGDTEDSYNLSTRAGAAATWITSTSVFDALAINVENAIADSITGNIVALSDDNKILRSISADGQGVSGGEYVRVLFTVKDNFGRPVSGLAVEQDRNFKLSTSVAGLSLSGVTISETDVDGTYETSEIEWTKAGAVDITIQVTSVVKELKLTRSFNVVAGVPANVALVEGTDATFGANTSSQKLAVEKNKVNKVTIQVVDAFGNPVSATSNRDTIRVMLAGTPAAGKYLSFRNADGVELTYVDIKAGRNTATFNVVTDATGLDPAQTFTLTATTKVGDWDNESSETNDAGYGVVTVTIK